MALIFTDTITAANTWTTARAVTSPFQMTVSSAGPGVSVVEAEMQLPGSAAWLPLPMALPFTESCPGTVRPHNPLNNFQLSPSAPRSFTLAMLESGATVRWRATALNATQIVVEYRR